MLHIEKEAEERYENERNGLSLCVAFSDGGNYVKDYIISEIERRQKLILSEPDGIVRETMIQNLLLDL